MSHLLSLTFIVSAGNQTQIGLAKNGVNSEVNGFRHAWIQGSNDDIGAHFLFPTGLALFCSRPWPPVAPGSLFLVATWLQQLQPSYPLRFKFCPQKQVCFPIVWVKVLIITLIGPLLEPIIVAQGMGWVDSLGPGGVKFSTPGGDRPTPHPTPPHRQRNWEWGKGRGPNENLGVLNGCWGDQTFLQFCWSLLTPLSSWGKFILHTAARKMFSKKNKSEPCLKLFSGPSLPSG